MEKTNKFNSIADAKILKEFAAQRGTSLFDHSSNSNFITDFISAAYVLCPEMIEIKGYVFISDFLNLSDGDLASKVSELELRFNYNKADIERSVNSWSLGDFFIGKDCDEMGNEKILKQFGEILVYFWTRRVRELFPEKNIVVEYGDEIMGELGLTITMYQQS